MKKHFTFLIVVLFLVAGSQANAQSYIGHTVDNYSGVHGVILNPSAVVDSRFRTDINLLSISGFAGSDYFGINLDNVINTEDGFEIGTGVQKSPKDNNQFFLNSDILGPSFMFNLSPKSSIALTSRARAFLNLNNINGTLYESIQDDFDQNENFDFNVNNFSGTIHAWGELGLTYGRILLDRERNFLKGGVTLKYLQGAGSNYVNAPSATGQYDATAESLTTTGSLSFGSTPGFDSGDIDFSNLSSGFGADIGFTYEYRPVADDPLTRKHNKYKFKLGASVTDIGSISYDDSELTSYDLNKTLDVNNFEGNDLETVLEENYEGTTEIVSTKINLPTALHIVADYQLRNRLYLSAQGSYSLVPEDRAQANRIINSVTIAPRLETRWLSIYLPASIRQYDGFAMGAGLRLGPLTLGSGSVISNLLNEETKTTDIYAGLKIPIYQ